MGSPDGCLIITLTPTTSGTHPSPILFPNSDRRRTPGVARIQRVIRFIRPSSQPGRPTSGNALVMESSPKDPSSGSPIDSEQRFGWRPLNAFIPAAGKTWPCPERIPRTVPHNRDTGLARRTGSCSGSGIVHPLCGSVTASMTRRGPVRFSRIFDVFLGRSFSDEFYAHGVQGLLPTVRAELRQLVRVRCLHRE